MRINRLWSFILLFGLIATLTGCNDDRSTRDLRQYISELKQSSLDKQKKIKPITLELPPSLVYRASSLRAPVEGAPPVVSAAHIGSGSVPLQAFPLSVLRLMGTVTEDGHQIAYVLTPDNMIYQVKLGDPIGDRQGKVSSIESNRVTVTEKETEAGKQPLDRVVTLQLKEAQ